MKQVPPTSDAAMSSAAIRDSFLNFFAKKSHERVHSGPIVPDNDPTLMFVNAGMVPFKDVFVGKAQRARKRATSAQKCIRISGKHNDLENVGVTARHHTFFEMLGNFSFGDYFKREAVAWAWEFITQELCLEEERLVVTVFGGEDGVPADEEAEKLWRDVVGVPKERIFRCGAADNFWQMGDTGPCGPCSEIHYYLGDGAPNPKTFGEEPADDGRGWFELWNLVFMQFEKQADGTLKDLPAPSIDTGAGLERLAVVKQGVLSNYDTDLLKPLVMLASEISGKPYRGTQEDDDVSMRVIADHARTTAFLMAEGVFPDRDGRSYVLRRVMRRAIRHGHRLGINEPFFYRAAERVVDLMAAAYPELEERRALIVDLSRQEEERFRRTLRKGLELMDEWHQGETTQEVANPKAANQGTASSSLVLPGSLAFQLYDTYGFPLDLQQVIASERGFVVDESGFDESMAEARAKSAGSKVGSAAVQEVYHQLREKLGASTFLGYEEQGREGEHLASKVLALVQDGMSVDELTAGSKGEVVVRETPFYAESGGQVGDEGEIAVADGLFLVTDTQKPIDGLIVHRGTMKKSTLRVGQEVKLCVSVASRRATRANHSATHLLHHALREVLGSQAMQRGSRVGPQGLRFDYSASKPLKDTEIARIEARVMEAILANTEVQTDVLPVAEAKNRGAIGIFEEKYGDEVRMLSIGPSLELCGGTHVSRTGDIGMLKVLSDAGLAAGVRRIEALTGLAALKYCRKMEGQLGSAAQLLKTSPFEVTERVQGALEQSKKLGREVERLRSKLLSGGTGDLSASARDMGGMRVLGTTVDLADPKALRELADQLRDRLKPAVVLLGAKTESDKAVLVCSVSKELTSKIRAGAIVKEAAALVGGNGGGRADFAQAGGSDPSRLGLAVERVYQLVEATS